MNQLLIAAVIFANSSLGKDTSSVAEHGTKSRIKNIYINLASTSCKVIRTLEQGAPDPDDFASCFCTCVAVLSSLIEKTGAALNTTWEIDNRYYIERLCHVFKEFDVIRSLVSQAVRHSSDNTDNIAVLSALGLFTKMAASGDYNMLSLVIECGNHNIPNTALFASTGHDDDPRHIVWRASMNLVGACLRSTSRDIGVVDGEMARRVSMIAVDFLRENKNAVLGCLKQCSFVEFGPNASNATRPLLPVRRTASV